jgi:hypothetical protein
MTATVGIGVPSAYRGLSSMTISSPRLASFLASVLLEERRRKLGKCLGVQYREREEEGDQEERRPASKGPAGNR